MKSATHQIPIRDPVHLSKSSQGGLYENSGSGIVERVRIMAHTSLVVNKFLKKLTLSLTVVAPCQWTHDVVVMVHGHGQPDSEGVRK